MEKLQSIKIYIVKHEYLDYSSTLDGKSEERTEIIGYYTNKKDAEDCIENYKEDCWKNNIEYVEDYYYIDEGYLLYRDEDLYEKTDHPVQLLH